MENKKYTTELLREKLGHTLDALLDKTQPMELDRAKAIADVAQVMINVAKVEIEHMRITGGQGTGFIVEQEEMHLSDSKATLSVAATIAQKSDEANNYASGVTQTYNGVTLHKGSRY